MASYIGAIDQGTTSTRFIVFDRSGQIVSSAQRPHEQIYPKPGWVEHDPEEIWRRTEEVIGEAMRTGGLDARDLAAIGITNQRETTLVWNRSTGRPIYNAIVWQDTRVAGAVAEMAANGGQDRYRAKTGLPLATYFSGLKLRWILENVAGARKRAEAGELVFGNIDTFLIWKLSGGVHVTDVTNASRTQLMDLKTLQWDPEILSDFQIPAQILPESPPVRRYMGRHRSTPSTVCRSPATWAISTRPWSARSASTQAARRTPTEPGASCCSIRENPL